MRASVYVQAACAQFLIALTRAGRASNVRMQRSGWDKVQVEATAAGR
jgi:hypothetical protein